MDGSARDVGWRASLVTSYVREIAREIRSELRREQVDQPEMDDLLLLYALLALTKGVRVTREDVHDAWSSWVALKGEEHESAIPFRELPDDVRAEDDPYVKAIRSVANRRSLQP